MSTGPIGGDGDGDSGDGDGDSGDGDTDGDGDGDTGDGDGDNNPEECGEIREESPQATGGVDVIMLLDTSGSMLHAATQVASNLATFIQNFEGTSADTRVVMITRGDPATGSPVANDANKYRYIESEVDSQKLYSVALDQFPNYQDFLRPNAATQFVMITDDNDEIAPNDFRAQMEALLGHDFTQHAIASENYMDLGVPCYSEAQLWDPLCSTTHGTPIPPIPAVCGAAAIGETYNSLAGQTGGETMSVCKSDWQPVFEKLKAAVIAAVPLPCDYPLADVQGDDFDKDQVKITYSSEGQDEEFGRAGTGERDKCGDNTGWFYDDPAAPTAISLCPAACDAVQAGGEIKLGFGCPPTIIY